MPHDHDADYLRHIADAEDLLPHPEHAKRALPTAERIAVAQTRAILALAAAVRGERVD